jgi:ubiquinone/menaquinone biosynthesis C-methylase UbiE
MRKRTGVSNQAGRTYREGASHYDAAVRRFDLFRFFGFDIPAWRKEAVEALQLERGATVVDMGCGTGLNFPLIQASIGPEGRLLGVDLSQAMVDQAQRRVAAHRWQNVELTVGDAARFTYPARLDGVLSTFALILVPECRQAVCNASQALAPGGHLVVLDMAWPAAWPGWFRHVLFFLRSYGVTDEVLGRQPWKTIWRTMEQSLVDTTRKSFWMGGFYLATGTRAASPASHPQNGHVPAKEPDPVPNSHGDV